MDNQIIKQLADQYGKLDAITTEGHQKLAEVLDKAPDQILKILAISGIKFVSPMARNRCVRRGIIK